MPEEPLDRLAIVPVAELTCELEDASGRKNGDTDATAAAVDLGVAIARVCEGGG